MSATADPLEVRLTPYIPHVPEPPQQAFLWLHCLEALYGGAAGGGKSDALLMAALQYVDQPDYAAILFRRTYADLSLPGALMDRSKQWLAGTDARWVDIDKTWRFPSGATLSFGYLQTSNDKYRYQSAEFQFVGFDELTQFPKADYLYLFSRLRKAEGSPLPLRMRAATNPGGIGHRWVHQRFIAKDPDPDDPTETEAKRRARIFIPAKLADNPNVDQDAYVEALQQLDPETRQQLLEGDWNARQPGAWVFPIGLDEVFELGAEYDAQRAAGRMAPPVDQRLINAADWGVHSHLLLLWPLEAGGFYVAKEIVNDTASIRTVAPRVAAAATELGWPVREERFDASMPGLNDAYLEQLSTLMPKPKWTAIPFGKYKALTVDYLKLLVANTAARTEGTLPPYLAISERGCPILAEQLRGWKYADPDAGRIDKGDDHGPDALVAGAAPEAARRRRS